MSKKADFYIGVGSKVDWIGSLVTKGEPWNIPTDIFIQVNKSMFEELVIEHIQKSNGFVRDDKDRWPHVWPDSSMTDYTYLFDTDLELIMMSLRDKEFLYDPLKIIQGYNLGESIIIHELPAFPIMISQEKYGHKSSAAV